tara:strand:- start:885 stop:1073 length:189 start_codon:yes stop_codon:yes gene_type:complete
MSKMTKQEKIKSLKELIADTEEMIKETPVNGIPGTCIEPHSVLLVRMIEAAQQIQQLEEGEA